MYFSKSNISLSTYLLALLIVTLSSYGCQNEIKKDVQLNNEKEILLKRVQEFNIAFRDGHMEKLEKMITINYLHTNSNSKAIGRNEWLKYLKKRKTELSSGDLVIDKYQMGETEIAIYDDMAIVTAKISFSSIRNNEQKENEFRITNVWIKEASTWKRAGFHDTRIK